MTVTFTSNKTLICLKALLAKLKIHTFFLLITLISILSSPLYAETDYVESKIVESEISVVETSETNDSQTPPQLPIQTKQNISIGILTQTPRDSTKGTPWQHSFDRLNSHPKYHFTPLFLSAEQLSKALVNDELDFVICDAINYLKLEKFG